MSPARFRKVEELYHAACERAPDERSLFLDEACRGDEELRREVESLLAQGSSADGILDCPSVDLPAGTQLGPYRIEGILGAGGMGKVYHAVDTRLGRSVAIKTSTRQFSGRFDREARAISALAHPHICTLYDIGPNYLVMERVEGETLAGRLSHGPLAAKLALRYAIEIADALAAAHGKGIVHRDLKPGNLMSTKSGIKVLDFGLAKLARPAEDGHTAETATGSHIVLGTPAYMSPEQRQGKECDARSDIFSFGLVLYEMLTGSRFSESGPPVTPPALDRTLRKCLAPDPGQRWQTATDLRDELEWIVAAGGAAEATSRRRSSWKIWTAPAALAILAAGGLWISWRTKGLEDKPLVRLDVDLGSDVSVSLAGGSDPILSPDGARIAYVSGGRIVTRRLDEAEARTLGETQGASSPFFSPDGQWIGFFSQGRLRKVAVDGGAPIELCPATAYFTGGAWGDDNSIIASLSAAGPLWRVPAGGGKPEAITKLDTAAGEMTHRYPQILSGGRALLFTSHTSILGFDDARIDVITLRDGRRRTLVRGGTFGRYLPSGHLIYVNRGGLFAAPFDIDKLEMRGKPTLMLDQVSYSVQFGSASVSFSRDGTLVYRGGRPGNRVLMRWLDSGGGVQPLLRDAGTYMDPSVSPDGTRLAVRDEITHGIWIYDPAKDSKTRIVSNPEGVQYPLWTPDSRFIIYRSHDGMSWVRADGSGEPHPLTHSERTQFPHSLTKDGRYLAFEERGVGGGMGGADLWTVSIENNGSELRAGEPKPFLRTASDELHPSFSPDGRWLAYTSDESGNFQVYVRSFPDAGGKETVGSGHYPRFSRRGNELFFLNQNGQLMVARYATKNGVFQAERPRIWSQRRLADFGIVFGSFDVAPDGRIAALMPPDDSGQARAENHVIFLENFFDELRRRVPLK